MELRNVQAFVVASETLHFGEAAQLLHVSQPALSRRIQKLEEELGVRLFDRKGHGVVVTDAGRIFLDDAVRILQHVERSTERMQQVGRGRAGVLRIGFVASLTFSLIPALLRSVRERAPQVRLELKEMGTAEQVTAIEADTVDVGFVRPPLSHGEGFSTRPLMEERILAVVASRHPLAGKDVLEVSELASEPFVMYPRNMGPGLFDRIVATCQRAGFSPNIVQEAALVPTVVGLVAGELGVALVPESAKYLGAHDVSFKPLLDPEAVTELAAIWKSDSVNPVLETLFQCLDNVLPA